MVNFENIIWPPELQAVFANWQLQTHGKTFS